MNDDNDAATNAASSDVRHRRWWMTMIKIIGNWPFLCRFKIGQIILIFRREIFQGHKTHNKMKQKGMTRSYSCCYDDDDWFQFHPLNHHERNNYNHSRVSTVVFLFLCHSCSDTTRLCRSPRLLSFWKNKNSSPKKTCLPFQKSSLSWWYLRWHLPSSSPPSMQPVNNLEKGEC